MKILIRNIRNYVGLSQEEFAERLGVTFATINRWENDRAKPARLAQEMLYEFCREMNIPVCDMLIQRIREEAERISVDSGRVILYHGSKSGIEGRIAPLSRRQCDFGRGFYMGTEPMQPLTLISGYEKSRFYIVSVSTEGLNSLEVPPDLSWAMVVAYNRGKMDGIRGSRLFDEYRRMCTDRDLIIGSIADDRMFYVLDNFFLGNITDLALVKSLSFLELGRQYAAVSSAGCNAVRVEKEIEISYLEKKFLQDVSENNRIKGVSTANEICRNYRREGRFFDEILSDGEEG